MRKKIVKEVIVKDKELGYFYDVPEIPTGKLGQNTFDNTETLIINPYGYVVSCPAKADFMSNSEGKFLNARKDFLAIVDGYNKCNSCQTGNFSCDADKYDRFVRKRVES